MSHYYTLARPYAKAVFNSALAKNKLQDWQTVLQILTAAIETQKLSHMISDPRFSNEAWLMCLNKIYADMLPNLEKKFSEEINNFLKLLLEYQRLYVLPDILTLYKRLVAMHQGILVVQVSSPFEINETQKKKLTEALEKRYQIKMEMNYHLDKDLLGGVMMRSRGFVIDGSVRGHLRRLKNDLMR